MLPVAKFRNGQLKNNAKKRLQHNLRKTDCIMLDEYPKLQQRNGSKIRGGVQNGGGSGKFNGELTPFLLP